MRIYLDFNATAPPAPGVVDTVCRVLRDIPGNPSSIHAIGQQARAVLDDARTSVAALIDAAPSELVLTGGGTEADNLALRGAAHARQSSTRRRVICSPIEHEAVLNTAMALEKQGWQVTRLPIGRTGIVDPADLTALMDDNVAFVSVMHGNNEIGTLQPIAKLAEIAHAHGALMHTDAVQTTGKIPVSVQRLGVDLLSLSGHKFGGPKGTGALWIKRGLRLGAQQTGGRQERSRRGGTENVAGLAGMAVAATYARETMSQHSASVERLRNRLESAILAAVPETSVNGTVAHRVPNTSNISFGGVEAESLLIALDLDGIAVSTGSACSSGSLEPSHVLAAMGLSPAQTRSALRFSLGPQTTEAEVDTVADRLPALVQKLRRLTQTASSLAVGPGAGKAASSPTSPRKGGR